MAPKRKKHLLNQRHGKRCRGKLCYSSARHAEKVRAARQAEWPETLRVYSCGVCGLYHLTSQEQR